MTKEKDGPKDGPQCFLSPTLQPLTTTRDIENRPEQEEDNLTPADPPETDRRIMISLDGPATSFQYRKASSMPKRVRFSEDLGLQDRGKRHHC